MVIELVGWNGLLCTAEGTAGTTIEGASVPCWNGFACGAPAAGTAVALLLLLPRSKGLLAVGCCIVAGAGLPTNGLAAAETNGFAVPPLPVAVADNAVPKFPI